MQKNVVLPVMKKKLRRTCKSGGTIKSVIKGKRGEEGQNPYLMAVS